MNESVASAQQDFWFTHSPTPMFETSLPRLAPVVDAIRARLADQNPLGEILKIEREALRDAHNDGILVRANPAMCEFFALSEVELFAAWPSLRDNGLIAAFDDEYVTALLGHGANHASWLAEWTLPDGAVRSAKVVVKVAPGANKTFASIMNLLVDVSEYRREARLAFEDNPTAMIELDMTEIGERAIAAIRRGVRGAALRDLFDELYPKMRLIRGNTAWRSLFKTPIEEFDTRFLGASNLELRKANVDVMFESVSKGAQQRAFIAPVERPDGSVRYVISRTRTIGPPASPWSRTQTTYTDITISREAELQAQAEIEAARFDAERQRARWERSAALANAASFEVDVRTQSFLPSSSLEALLGATVETLNAKGDLLLSLVPSPWREDLQARYFNALRTGEPMSHEHPIERPDGRRIWVASNFIVDATADGERKATGFGFLQDITARKQMEAQALEAVDQAEAALAEKASLLALYREAPVETHEPESELCDGKVDLARLLSRQISVLKEIKVRDAVLTRTLQELEDARDRAEQANKSKSQFLTVMSHELRTPLNAVIGYTEILLDDLSSQGLQVQGDLERIRTAARHLLVLITEILDFAKVDVNQMSLALNATPLADLITCAVDFVRPAAATKGLSVELSLAQNLGVGYIDAMRVKQCLLNLLSNAVKFTEQGQIRLSATRGSGARAAMIDIAVSDTGCGIAPNAMATLFEPFKQVDSSFTRRHEGTGLGLAISQKLARLMRGDVTVASAEGVGSTFTFSFQASQTACQAAA